MIVLSCAISLCGLCVKLHNGGSYETIVLKGGQRGLTDHDSETFGCVFILKDMRPTLAMSRCLDKSYGMRAWTVHPKFLDARGP